MITHASTDKEIAEGLAALIGSTVQITWGEGEQAETEDGTLFRCWPLGLGTFPGMFGIDFGTADDHGARALIADRATAVAAPPRWSVVEIAPAPAAGCQNEPRGWSGYSGTRH